MQHYSLSPQPPYQPIQQPIETNYWTQEPAHAQAYPSDITLENNSCDFGNIPADLFQPEEIFQLDQPIKPDYVYMTDSRMGNEVARSPPTLLDLGSGTIQHRELKTEDYWPQTGVGFMNDDSNASSNSRYNLNQSPDIPKIVNNNVVPSYEASKVDPASYVVQPKPTSSSVYDHNLMDVPEFKTENHYDLNAPSAKYLHGNTESFLHNFQNYQSTTKNLIKPNYQEYIDLGQYNDYANFLNIYENKVTHSDNMFNDLDFRIANSCNFNDSIMDYTSQCYDNVTNPQLWCTFNFQ